MRPTASFTLHAILAACLAALAATSAAAGRMDAWITIGGINGEEGDRSTQGSQGQHLEVHSYHWGVMPAAGSRITHISQISIAKPTDSSPPSGGQLDAGMKQLEAQDKLGNSAAAAASHEVKPPRDASLGSESERQAQTGHSMLGASEMVTVGGGRTESGAEGKYRTLRPRPVEAPLAQDGSLVIAATGMPCRIGARYPSLTLVGGGKSYLMEDVQVADCAASGPSEQITFVYGKVKVRGWDPKKKEE